MSRIFLSVFFFTACIYVGPISAQPPCGAGTTPTFTLTVNSVLYTNFIMEGSSSGCTVTGTFGSMATTGYTIALNAFTMPDPVIDFDLSFTGDSDPAVTLTMSTPYSGGPYSSIFANSSGTLMDNDGNGSASVFHQGEGNIQSVIVNDALVTTLNPGCSFSGQPAGFSQLCPSSTSTLLSGDFPSSGTLELDISYNLSAGDSYDVRGSASLATVPEPATLLLLAAALLAMFVTARRLRVT